MRLTDDQTQAIRQLACQVAGSQSRLQDTVGDKLLPLLLVARGEKPSFAIDPTLKG